MKEVGNMASEMMECKRFAAILSTALLLIQASFGALESLQSSVNHETGTTALAVLYICYLLSSLLLPPLTITRLKCKKTMAIGMFAYSVYIAANFYPKSYTLIPAAAVLGTGFGVLWPTVVVYITNLSACYARLKKRDITKYTKHFFSIIYSFVNLGSCSGAIIMSFMLKNLSMKSSQDVYEHNISSVAFANFTSASIFNNIENFQNDTSPKKCGLYYEKIEENVEESGKSPIIPPSTFYILLTVYLILSIIASLLCSLVTEIEENGTHHRCRASNNNLPKESKYNEDMLLNKSNEDNDIKAITDERSNKKYVCNISTTSKTDESLKTGSNTIVNEKLNDVSNFSLMKSTVNLVLTDKVALLFIGHTLHVGILKAFSRATFNAAWISCLLGIEYVGHVMILYSGILTVMGFVSSHILRFISTKLLFGMVLVVEVSIGIVLLTWKPEPHDLLACFIIQGLFALCYAMVKTQTPSAYSAAFPKHNKQAASLQGIMEALGLSTMFGLSGFVYPFDSLMLFLSTSVVGYVLFLFGCRVSNKAHRYYNSEKKSKGISEEKSCLGSDVVLNSV